MLSCVAHFRNLGFAHTSILQLTSRLLSQYTSKKYIYSPSAHINFFLTSDKLRDNLVLKRSGFLPYGLRTKAAYSLLFLCL